MTITKESNEEKNGVISRRSVCTSSLCLHCGETFHNPYDHFDACESWQRQSATNVGYITFGFGLRTQFLQQNEIGGGTTVNDWTAWFRLNSWFETKYGPGFGGGCEAAFGPSLCTWQCGICQNDQAVHDIEFPEKTDESCHPTKDPGWQIHKIRLDRDLVEKRDIDENRDKNSDDDETNLTTALHITGDLCRDTAVTTTGDFASFHFAFRCVVPLMHQKEWCTDGAILEMNFLGAHHKSSSLVVPPSDQTFQCPKHRSNYA